MNVSQTIPNDFLELDIVYSEFIDYIDQLPLILSLEEIEIITIHDVEYISKDDLLKIKKRISEKRICSEITINDSNLVCFNVEQN